MSEALYEMIARLIAPEAVKVFKYLMKYNESKEEEIAEDLKIDINELRKILYKLNEIGLVRSYKVRSEEEGKQYTYVWYVNVDYINQILLQRKKHVLERLKERLSVEEETYFYCPNDLTRYTYDEAMDLNFICPKCGTPLEMAQTNEYAEVLKKYIKKLSEEIEQESKIT